ncbi:flavin-containing amine oxidoreductase [Xylariales sp. PMI_506]|nr:flavin-containing amine oxidoreductase [Xylariales sp. PMI_506]
MDAYSISYTNQALRSSSRIWQDLKTCRHTTTVEVDSDPIAGPPVTASATSKRLSRASARKPHIGVIGAGLAGLKCADVLLEHGFEVTLIEGRDRLGGRVHQERLPSGYFVDCGPNWIHGTNDNPILDIAKETNTAVGSWDTTSYLLDENGKLLPVTEAEIYSTIMWNIIQEAFSFSNKNSTTIDPRESLWDFFQREIAKHVPNDDPDCEKKRKLVLQMAEMWGAFVGSPIYTQSLKFFWLEECLEGENLFCAGTYQKILASIAKPALEGAHIRLATKVTGFRTSNEDGGKATVITAGGEMIEFDEVVCTTPLGWLKRHLTAFTPELPSRLSKAIDSIGYGCLEKVYITFPKAFWAVPGSDNRVINGFCQWLSPTYALDSNPRKWNQEIVELASLDPEASHPTLLFYTYGEQSQYITREVVKLSTRGKKDAFLYEFFRPYYSRLPHYDASSIDCQPVGCLSTEWLNDEFAGNGSYSNFQVGLQIGDEDIAVMREGLPERGLWFAGEHTAPFVALGTATGAYWSGESVGARIAKAYGRDKSTAQVVA